MENDLDIQRQILKAEEKLKNMKKKQQLSGDKKRQREFDKALKTVSKETKRERDNPHERLKQMVLVLDSSLSESREFMECLVEELEEVGVEHRVGRGGPLGGVRWRRKQRERRVSEDGKIAEIVSEKEEDYLLLTLEAQGFTGLVHYSKLAEQGLTLPPGAKTIKDFVEEVKDGDVTVSLAVEGLDKYFRGTKTKTNRQFQKQVLGTGSGGTTSSTSTVQDVTWLECQESIVSLQLSTGCSVRLCSGPEQLAQHIITLTKAICKKPSSKDNYFSFHSDAASGKRKRVESGDQVGTTWRNQLMQFNNLSEPMALAICAEYPSPAHLLSAYSLLENEKAALLLQDIAVRRGVGTVASTRRLGPVLSRRIHALLTATDPQVTIT